MKRRVFPKFAALQALRALEEASEASEGWMVGFNFKLDDWFIGHAALRLEKQSPKDLDANLIWKLSKSCHRLEYVVQLCEALKESASKLVEIHERILKPIASKVGKGVASLPDELLGLIFKFACHHEQEGTRHALWLSQVSRRFRGIVLEDRTLWSTTFHCYDVVGPEDIDRWIDRSGVNTDLHIVANCHIAFNGLTAYDLMEFCGAYGRRWKTLTLVGEWGDAGGSARSTVGSALDELTVDWVLNLPRLHELCLIERRHKSGSPDWYFSETDFTGESLWFAPNLRVLRCTQYIPPRPPQIFDTMTKFALDLTLLVGSAVDQLFQLCTFLLGIKSLLELDLELVNSIRNATEPLVHVNDTIELPVLKTFRFSLSSFYQPQDIRCMLEPWVQALRMPVLEQYTLSTDFFELPPGLILDPALHPQITSFTLEAPRRVPGESTSLFLNGRFEELSIPLEEFPNLSSLSLTTTLENLAFSRERNMDPDSVEEGCRLRELCLRSCTNVDAESLRRMVQSLKDADAWKTVERVVIQTCASLEYDDALEVLGKEKLYFTRA